MNILHILLVFTIIVFIYTFIVVFCWVNNRYFYICYSIYTLCFYCLSEKIEQLM